MEKFIKLMNNELVGFVFGVIVALIGYLGVYGEANAMWFVSTFSLVCIIAKEIVNSQMCDNPFKYWVPLSGIIGSIVTMLGILLC